MKQNISDIPAIIIAGGHGSRMGGVDKCLLEIGSKTILSHITEKLTQQTSVIYLNINGNSQRFSEYNLPLITDQTIPSIGPLGGLKSAMRFLSTQNTPPTKILTVASDCPFLPPNLLQKLLESSGQNNDVTYCHSNNRDHFITALWPTQLLPPLSEFIDSGGRSVGKFISTLQNRKVHFQYDDVDPFFNINTVEQLQKANNLFKSAHK